MFSKILTQRPQAANIKIKHGDRPHVKFLHKYRRNISLNISALNLGTSFKTRELLTNPRERLQIDTDLLHSTVDELSGGNNIVGGFLDRGVEQCQSNSTTTDPGCHGNEISRI